MSKKVKVYTTQICPYCIQAKQLLTKKGIAFETIDVTTDMALRKQMMADSGQRTVPQIWIGDYHVGGFTDLHTLDKSGQLDKLMAE